MDIRKANKLNLNEIMKIIASAKTIMVANGNATQWINGYPSRETIKQDIENDSAYIISKNNEIKGYFCFIKGNNPEVNYNVIKEGNWLNNEPYGVIHRLASDGTEKGIAQSCFDFCFGEINNIKVDTHENNIPMQNYFKKIGFEYCGIIYVADGSPRRAFQKKL